MMQQRLSILAENAVISQASYQASIAAAALIETELKLEVRFGFLKSLRRHR